MCGYVPGVHDTEDTEQHEPQLGAAPSEQHAPILAIDTALGTSVALALRDEVFTASSEDPRAHTEVIGELIAQVFRDASIDARSTRTVAVGVGPGPFTGLRIGISAAQAFALATDAQLWGVHSHDAVALEQFESGSFTSAIRVFQDAKRRELFVTEYDGLNTHGVPMRAASSRLLRRELYEPQPGDVWPSRISAAHLLRVALLRKQAWLRHENPQAIYLREPDVATSTGVKRVSS